MTDDSQVDDETEQQRRDAPAPPEPDRRGARSPTHAHGAETEEPEAEPQTAAWAEELVREATAGHKPGETHPTKEQQVLERIEKARRRAPKIKEDYITLAHGAGGKATNRLIEGLFLETFRNDLLAPLNDNAVFSVDGVRLALTTDSFVVHPIFFPGGDIGELAVNGTVNDIAVSGARPLYLSAGFILEEGFLIEDLRRIATSMRAAADEAGVQLVTGDTKVVDKGKADGLYINTSGVGVLERPVDVGAQNVRPGDAVLVSGPIGEHGITIMLARGDLDIEADITSDTAPLNGLIDNVLQATTAVRCMRDATRGGVATVLNEVAGASEVAVVIDEKLVPVSPIVTGASEILGIDPLYVACEGRLVLIVDGDAADDALAAMRSHPLGEQAAIIGRVKDDPPGLVLLRTEFGGTRIVDMLVGDPLPRIC